MSARDGGPAFPSHGSMGEVAHEGMSLRDYLAAHAPAEPQPWFVPVMPPQPASRWIGESGKEYETLRDAERAEGDCVLDANGADLEAWRHARLRQRYIQWPYAWADEMLRAREK